MLWFLMCVAALIGGYFIYGTFVEKVFGIKENRQTPAYSKQDGVDYVPMSNKKVYLVQLLNIAGVGPIFGPIMGALYGPAAMLWIVLGCIFAGAVHDYFSGMLSVRNGGASVPSITGRYLGNGAKHFMNIFAIILLLLVGVVFVSAPAGMITNLINDQTDFSVTMTSMVVIIFAYYIIATVVPVDKIIGRFYPVFGALLIFMSVGLISAIALSDEHTVMGGFEVTDMFTNMNPNDLPLWPALFITIACGAISGFHATQSPLMARCMQNEKNGRFIFFGAMIGEGVIALIWCALALSFFGSVDSLSEAVANGGPGNVVYSASFGLLGVFGGVLAFLGVVILPITSGDTAFRSSRLILAEYFNMEQKTLRNRLLMAVPLFVLGGILTQVDFGVIWRYFGFANQSTATMMLWTASAYLLRHNKLHWITTVPAIFMTTVCVSFIMSNSQLGFGLPMNVSTVGGIVTALLITAYVIKTSKGKGETELADEETPSSTAKTA
ncbi:putative Carbon starvation protein A [Vibrio nigripulchritudo SFn27]|uniref:Putative Carbon starvation protein A n=1 Tax=Vibrio nigripulchritudo TaxID=28173 RepID=U4KCQ8_9VIBR|nr:carbon starvation protein A [Vibrio nigripulchritudo]CCN83325.1 putative Carbon starvation protein A [Vibrio nigripulchritudo BLFn1]CCN86967.1 putative Carbon starvation protein A [Vibrio nigripulchritudo SFn27]CCN97435.1 putative Carbon starvation protein A [Vibrio nigripulchritudo ENn2]CCO38620.1 putative Carbon starvation protein A [Vibrio nigripulchritudo SFn135]CCO52771.1 putative Carbon starvation protein A [Vibrio nigripulchritudo Wn13]